MIYIRFILGKYLHRQKFKTKFQEPVVESGADPYVVLRNDWFYYCYAIKGQAIYIRKACTLDEIGSASLAFAT